ncbi:MAG: co-chaperone YbbN [Vibrio sp.]
MPASTMIDVTEYNFQQVLEHSSLTPVLFYFWAEASPESVQLLPALEQLVERYQGAVVLARLNCQQQQAIAAQFGIQAIPTIALFIQGQPVDGLGGAQPISAIEEMLERHLPNAEQRLIQQALELVAQGEYQPALTLLSGLTEPWCSQGEVKLALATCYLETGAFDAAEAMLASIPLAYQQGDYRTLLAKLELHQQAANSPELIALEQQWQADPKNPSLALELARQYHQVKRDEEALSLLWSWLSHDLNTLEGEMKKTLIDMLTALGQGNPLATQYRKQLYSRLY